MDRPNVLGKKFKFRFSKYPKTYSLGVLINVSGVLGRWHLWQVADLAG